MYRRGGSTKGDHITTERKLAILDKALSLNQDSDLLLKERIQLANELYHADKLSKELEDLLEKQPSNVTLWQGYIGATQSSLSHCSATIVVELYNKGLARLHQFRRGTAAIHTRPTEAKILDLVMQCGLFLRQAGLWEQLWTLLKLYLELNLAQPGTNNFKFQLAFDETHVTQLEEAALDSGAALAPLWLLVERLREETHWMPWTGDDDCGDPQRLVFVDDVSDLLHPITTTCLGLRLAMIVLCLLKVPSLPCRHTTQRCVSPNLPVWSTDSVETLLPLVFPVGTVSLEGSGLLQDVLGLTSGPQYLAPRLGQEQFLEFVCQVFRACAECLPEPGRTAFYTWWLRFERLLLVLERRGYCKLPHLRRKKLKSTLRNFLKEERNRNTAEFYREYALVELELGNPESAQRTLRSALLAQVGGVPVVALPGRAAQCCLYRTLCELLVVEDRVQAVAVLVMLALGTTPSEPGQVAEASQKFGHITTELLDELASEEWATGCEHLLPDFHIDWICCYVWLLYLTQSTWIATAFLEDVLTRLPESGSSSVVTVSCCRREALLECYVTVLHQHCHDAASSYSVLQDVLHRSLKEFPNNLYFLATIAKIEGSGGCVGSPWWKLSRTFTGMSSVMPLLVLILLTRQRKAQLDLVVQQTHSFLDRGGPVIPDPSTSNRLAALFRQLIKHPASKKCPLIWKLYLQFLHQEKNEGLYRNSFYQAVEECPWVKALYLDAVDLVPAELSQVQDLLIEKELRLHVTPEELQILRTDPIT